uniref:Mediator complex subunit 23 n=1 Tax=Globodera pallida TaxID=36090 RepID=A0A183BJB9_GLOPA
MSEQSSSVLSQQHQYLADLEKCGITTSNNLRELLTTCPYLADLEKCGITTSNNLRELLTTCPDPMECIREFQLLNSIQFPSLRPIMKLLDLHGIRRTEYHEAVFADLTDKMVTKLRALGEKPTPENVSKLEQHLERSFRLYRAPKIRPIVLETLAQLPNIADRYLKLIICDKEFYDQCSLPVKQQIWIKNESLFLEAIEPVLDAYILDKERLLLSATIGVGSDKQTNFFTCDSWKGRRQKKHIQELVSMVGQREILYCKLISIIRDRFLATDNPNYCSLHFELLMAAHDVNVEFLARVDPCHDFAWCLDACAKHHRAKLIDSQQMSKLRTLLDTSKKGQSNVVAQLSLIAGDPHILHMIASAAVKTIRDNAFSANPTKPRDLTSVHLMVKMLLMGLHAKDLLTEQKQLPQMMDPEIFTVFLAAFTTMIVQDAIRVELNNAPGMLEWLAKFVNWVEKTDTSLCKDLLTEQKQLPQMMDPEIFTVFLAAFTTMIVQDAIRVELNNAPEEVADWFWLDRERCPRIPSLEPFLRANPVCALLWVHYLAFGDPLPSSPSKRRPFEAAASLCYLDILPDLARQMAVADPHWAHLLTHRLLQCPSAFLAEPTATFLIRHFFVPQLRNVPSAKFHLLHLCAQHSSVFPPELFALAVDSLLPFSVEEEEEKGGEDNNKVTVLSFCIEFDKFREQLVSLRQQLIIKEKETAAARRADEGMEEDGGKGEGAGDKVKTGGAMESEGPEEGEIEDDDDD